MQHLPVFYLTGKTETIQTCFRITTVIVQTGGITLFILSVQSYNHTCALK